MQRGSKPNERRREAAQQNPFQKTGFFPLTHRQMGICDKKLRFFRYCQQNTHKVRLTPKMSTFGFRKVQAELENVFV